MWRCRKRTANMLSYGKAIQGLCGLNKDVREDFQLVLTTCFAFIINSIWKIKLLNKYDQTTRLLSIQPPATSVSRAGRAAAWKQNSAAAPVPESSGPDGLQAIVSKRSDHVWPQVSSKLWSSIVLVWFCVGIRLNFCQFFFYWYVGGKTFSLFFVLTFLLFFVVLIWSKKRTNLFILGPASFILGCKNDSSSFCQDYRYLTGPFWTQSFGKTGLVRLKIAPIKIREYRDWGKTKDRKDQSPFNK